jgi:hypothetical protein
MVVPQRRSQWDIAVPPVARRVFLTGRRSEHGRELTALVLFEKGLS